jgi:two-component system, chemotaxis family, protein-glutamate methylesterase/glutaminase
MMAIRVLVVDDSVLYRRVLTDVLASIPGVDVVGAASNGQSALERVRELRPDLVTLDLEMPGMGGLQVLEAMGKSGMKSYVIVVSAASKRGGQLALRALQQGAFDFITKPEQSSPEENRTAMHAELAPRVRVLAQRLEVRSILRGTAAANVSATAGPSYLHDSCPVSDSLRETSGRMSRLAAGTKPEMVLIGVSTGGPNALTRVFADLPANLGVPVLVVQHMPPLFTQLLAEELSTRSLVPVKEAVDGDVICANRAYLAPGGKHMRLVAERGERVIQITDDPPINHCKPSVDYLFRSIARGFPGRSLAVILTGMGDDGTAGLRLLKQAGCPVIAQDEASCVVYGMPKAAVDAGLADVVLPLDAIAARITSIVRGVGA